MGLIGLLLSSLFRSVVLVGGWMGGGEGGVDYEENELEWRWLSVYLSIYIYIYIYFCIIILGWIGVLRFIAAGDGRSVTGGTVSAAIGLRRMLWNGLGCFLRCSGMLWDTLACSGMI